MPRKEFPKINERELNVVPDAPDIRDYIYEPALIELQKTKSRPRSPAILDQGAEGACTGFALAAVINLLNLQRGFRYRVSPRMLYEMAKKYDEWPGEEYEGSSCRGAIQGWYSMGVCRESKWKYDDPHNEVTVPRAKDARENTLGVYYRVCHDVTHFHAALNEVDALYVSAEVHAGWEEDQVKNGKITLQREPIGGHAFAIVGYDDDGFWIQNSWGKRWGKQGLALWSYEDWQLNIRDAWVFRMGLPARQIWHLPPNERSCKLEDPNQLGRTPARAEIAGHFVHVDDGKFHTEGKYWSNAADVKTTAEFIAKDARFEHLLLYAHGGLNSPKASASRISSMKEVFKDNGIYPYHLMYDTGLMEELKDIILRRDEETSERAGGFTDFIDRLIERSTRKPGRALWREMKAGASKPFAQGRDGEETLEIFMRAFAAENKQIKIHVAGHSTGAILMAYLLNALQSIAPKRRIGSCHLMAPAATVDLFKTHYHPLLVSGRAQFGIDKLTVYNLTEAQELKDNVAKVYRKSLLYLVSRAFEEDTPEQILGMQRYNDGLKRLRLSKLKFVYSGERGTIKSESESHGGFDNDAVTMNSVLRGILGRRAEREFTPADLDY